MAKDEAYAMIWPYTIDDCHSARGFGHPYPYSKNWKAIHDAHTLAVDNRYLKSRFVLHVRHDYPVTGEDTFLQLLIRSLSDLAQTENVGLMSNVQIGQGCIEP